MLAHGSMSLFRRFFYRRPPDGLLEITERVYGERKICVFIGWGGEGFCCLFRFPLVCDSVWVPNSYTGCLLVRILAWVNSSD